MAEPGAPKPKFPVRASGPILALPRRGSSPFADANGASASGERVRGAGRDAGPAENLAEFERSLRQLQIQLAERERVAIETDAKLAERERDIAEAEALLIAREKLVAASRRAGPAPAMTAQEKEALEQMRAALDKQEATIQEARQSIKEREQFLEESETKLFAKVTAQQEQEIELEQREEDLLIRERQLREAIAASDPAAAEAMKTEENAAKTHDEFNE